MLTLFWISLFRQSLKGCALFPEDRGYSNFEGQFHRIYNMKRTHLVALVLLAVGIIFMVFSSNDFSTFSSFQSAETTGKRVKIAGQLSLEDAMTYNPEKDPNYFSFFMTDQNGDKRKVVILEPKRRDFERSEQIVVTGKMTADGEFLASEMLLKCPSKYKEEELALRKQASL